MFLFQGLLDITHSQHTQTDYGRLKEEHADNGGARINNEIMGLCLGGGITAASRKSRNAFPYRQ